MNKREFLTLLKNELRGLPEGEIRESLNFYNEMISDGIEEGLTEAEAIAKIGSISQISAQIKDEKAYTVTEAPVATATKRKLTALEITLLILGSPIWISLIAAAFATVVSVFAAVLTVGISLLATEVVVAVTTVVAVWVFWIVLAALDISFLAAAVSGSLCFILYALTNRLIHGTFILGCALVCSGLSVFAFALTKKTLPILVTFTKRFTTESVRVIKRSFILTCTSIENATRSIVASIKKGAKK